MKLNINGITYLGVPDINSDEIHGVIVNKSKYKDLYDQLDKGEMTINHIANKNMLINAIDIDWNGAEIYDCNGNIQTVNSTSDLLKIINKISSNVLTNGCINNDKSEPDISDDIENVIYSYNYLIFESDNTNDFDSLSYVNKNDSNIYNHTIAKYETYKYIRYLIISNGNGRILIPKDTEKSYEVVNVATTGRSVSTTDGSSYITIRFDHTQAQSDSVLTIDLKINNTSSLKYKTIRIYKTNSSSSKSQTLYKEIKHTIIQSPLAYYWYIGLVNPMTMDDIFPIIDNNTSFGWRLIGEDIDMTQYNINNKLWGDNDVVFNTGGRKYWYLALPSKDINIYYKGTLETNLVLDDTVNTKIIEGVEYYIYKSSSRARYIPYELY